MKNTFKKLTLTLMAAGTLLRLPFPPLLTRRQQILK